MLLTKELVVEALESVADNQKATISKALSLSNDDIKIMAKEFEEIMSKEGLDLTYAGQKFSKNAWKGFHMTLDNSEKLPDEMSKAAIPEDELMEVIKVVGKDDMPTLAIIISMFACVCQCYIVSKSEKSE